MVEAELKLYKSCRRLYFSVSLAYTSQYTQLQDPLFFVGKSVVFGTHSSGVTTQGNEKSHAEDENLGSSPPSDEFADDLWEDVKQPTAFSNINLNHFVAVEPSNERPRKAAKLSRTSPTTSSPSLNSTSPAPPASRTPSPPSSCIMSSVTSDASSTPESSPPSVHPFPETSTTLDGNLEVAGFVRAKAFVQLSDLRQAPSSFLVLLFHILFCVSSTG